MPIFRKVNRSVARHARDAWIRHLGVSPHRVFVIAPHRPPGLVGFFHTLEDP